MSAHTAKQPCLRYAGNPNAERVGRQMVWNRELRRGCY